MNRAIADGMTQIEDRRREEWERHRNVPLDVDVVSRYAANFCAESFENEEGRHLDESLKSVARDRIIKWYVRASLLAKRHQRVHRAAGLLAYSLATLSVACVAVAVLAQGLATIAFVVEAVLLSAILLIVSRADRSSAHARWVENRVLTERMRTMAFLVACGVVPETLLPPRPLAGEDPRAGWIGLALEEIVRSLPPLAATAPLERRVAFVRTWWIGKQIEFHAHVGKHAQRASRRLERTGLVVFGLALAAALVHIALRVVHGLVQTRAEDMLTFLALVLPAVGAALEGIRTHREFSRVSRRSHAMVDALASVDARLATVETEHEFVNCLRDAEELTVREVEDWLLLMRTVELKAMA